MSRAPVPLPQGKARPTRDGRVRRSRAACENFQPSLRRRAGRTPLERSFARPPEREHSNRSIRFPIRASRAILERSPLRRASARPSIPKGLWDGRWETKWNGRGGSAGIAPGRPRQMVLEARTGNRREHFVWSRRPRASGRAFQNGSRVPPLHFPGSGRVRLGSPEQQRLRRAHEIAEPVHPPRKPRAARNPTPRLRRSTAGPAQRGSPERREVAEAVANPPLGSGPGVAASPRGSPTSRPFPDSR